MNRKQLRQELATIGSGAHALAGQLLGNPHDAEDAVQDALTTVLAKPRAYDPARGAFQPWFLRVVRNRCFDLLRQRRPVDDIVDQLIDPSHGPDQLLEDEQRDAELYRALNALGREHREIIALRDYVGLSYRDIAGVLDVAEGTVMSRLHRARMALKTNLETNQSAAATAGAIAPVVDVATGPRTACAGGTT